MVDKKAGMIFGYPQFCSKTHVLDVDKVDNTKKNSENKRTDVENHVNNKK